MTLRSTRQAIEDLLAGNRCVVVDDPVDPRLEMAEIQRRVYANGGPAVLFTNPIGCGFPMACNLFGSLDQARYLFRNTIDGVRAAIELKIDPLAALQRPWRYRSAPMVGWRMRPKIVQQAASRQIAITKQDLPHLVCWPEDGGAFITLPQVLTQSPGSVDLRRVNLGMYRVQIDGNDYNADEVGMHYQIHRGIGVHHQAAAEANQPLPVAISVGGTPAMTLAAVMPLPEGMSELTFAGALAGHRIPMCLSRGEPPIYADADFVISGWIDPTRTKPEGPFGDHLGYYARVHDFPVMTIKSITHRPGAIWPFTVVGRPPQEDTTFGQLIHELTGPVLPTVLPGVTSINAVDEAGVHPLLLAVGSERYDVYRRSNRPAELLTQAFGILGQGQLSLAKYLWIINGSDAPGVRASDDYEFFHQFLQRVQWSRDVHFVTNTTMDTLDYSGGELNQGSKVIMAARGQPIRELARELYAADWLQPSTSRVQVVAPGVLAMGLPSDTDLDGWVSHLTAVYERSDTTRNWCEMWPLWVVVDDPQFAAAAWKNFLWTSFTRSNPAADITGIAASIDNKHWGCRGPLIIDARSKPHHAPGLYEDPQTSAAVDARAARGGPLARYL